MRLSHKDFRVGMTFDYITEGTRRHMLVTDVGTRTIAAVLLGIERNYVGWEPGRLSASDISGPPYSVQEHILSKMDFLHAYPEGIAVIYRTLT